GHVPKDCAYPSGGTVPSGSRAYHPELGRRRGTSHRVVGHVLISCDQRVWVRSLGALPQPRDDTPLSPMEQFHPMGTRNPLLNALRLNVAALANAHASLKMSVFTGTSNCAAR